MLEIVEHRPGYDTEPRVVGEPIEDPRTAEAEVNHLNNEAHWNQDSRRYYTRLAS